MPNCTANFANVQRWTKLYIENRWKVNQKPQENGIRTKRTQENERERPLRFNWGLPYLCPPCLLQLTCIMQRLVPRITFLCLAWMEFRKLACRTFFAAPRYYELQSKFTVSQIRYENKTFITFYMQHSPCDVSHTFTFKQKNLDDFQHGASFIEEKILSKYRKIARFPSKRAIRFFGHV